MHTFESEANGNFLMVLGLGGVTEISTVNAEGIGVTVQLTNDQLKNLREAVDLVISKNDEMSFEDYLTLLEG